MDWCVVLLSLFAASACAEDRWVWGGSHRDTQDNNVLTPRIPGWVEPQPRVLTPRIPGRVEPQPRVLTPRIPGRVEPQPRVLTPRIPGRVEPQPRHFQHRVTTPPPDITTFRPSIQLPLGRSISLRGQVSNSLPPFFPFLPFGGLMGLQRLPVTPAHRRQQTKLQQPSLQLSRPPHHALPIPGDGTIKSRVPEDTAFDSVAVLEDEDKYTTLDKHQSEQRQVEPLPRPSKEHLGGLHPDEVFYADEDLLIIKGGGFNSDKFEEPSQTLDDSHYDDLELGQGSQVSPSVALPNPDLEYNGNIPAILPPPSSNLEPADHIADQTHFAVFVESPSRTSTMSIQIPYVYPLDDLRDANRTPDYFLPFGEAEQNDNSLYVKRSAEEFPVLQSLSGDTAVNFLEPRPSVNPDAELVSKDQPHIVLLNQPVPTHQPPQVLYQQPHFVYQYPVYPYQQVYRPRRPSRVEVYRRPYNQPSRPRPKL